MSRQLAVKRLEPGEDSAIQKPRMLISRYSSNYSLGQYFSYVLLSSPIRPGLVLQVCVNKTREITKASNRVVYLRRGAQNLSITTDDGLRTTPVQHLFECHASSRSPDGFEQMFFQAGIDAVQRFADLGLRIRLGAHLIKNQPPRTGVVELIKITAGTCTAWC